MITHSLRALAIIAISWAIAGCGSSEKTSQQESPSGSAATTQGAGAQSNAAAKAGSKVDTLSVNVKNTAAPSYDANGTAPAAKYSVQVGAYKVAENAARVAALAKERFSTNVYTIQDNSGDLLYKVLVGDFASKDEARRFRDDMAKQYASDYKDAWVAENPQK